MRRQHKSIKELEIMYDDHEDIFDDDQYAEYVEDEFDSVEGVLFEKS